MAKKAPNELEAVLHEIERGIEAKLYYLALAVTLTVPDVCACLEFDPDNPAKANFKTYTEWWDKNIGYKFQNITGSDVYYLRGGTIHRGNFEHKNSRFNRIMFIGPESTIKFHDVVVNIAPGVEFSGVAVEELRLAGKVLMMDVKMFCESVMNAAREWAEAKALDPIVQSNMSRLVRYRPYGMPPFSVGIPTIA